MFGMDFVIKYISVEESLKANIEFLSCMFLNLRFAQVNRKNHFRTGLGPYLMMGNKGFKELRLKPLPQTLFAQPMPG